jgi:hypothetical protein
MMGEWGNGGMGYWGDAGNSACKFFLVEIKYSGNIRRKQYD